MYELYQKDRETRLNSSYRIGVAVAQQILDLFGWVRILDPVPRKKNMESKPVDVDKAIQLAQEGLGIDGAHHKQWYLEEILKSLGCDLPENYEENYEAGIAP